MADENRSGWRRFQPVRITKKSLSKGMRRAESVTIRHARKFLVRRWSNVREVRRHIAAWVLAAGVLIGASGLQLVWYQTAYQQTAPANDGTYAEAVLGPVDTLNPLFASTSAEESASALLFSRLFTYDTTGHLKGDLATGMTINQDKTVYTVTLRDDVSWHDGRPLTAKDVAFTINLIKDPATRSTITGWAGIGVKAVNDVTVEFTLPAAYASFSHALTFPVVPEHLLGSIAPSAIRENQYGKEVVGSGPFSLRLIQSIDVSNRKVIHLIKNERYYQGAPKLERFQLHVYANKDAILNALRTGEVNAAADISASDVSMIETRRYDIISKPIQSGVYALFNTEHEFLKDKSVRQALQLATDTKAIRAKLPVSAPDLYLPFINGQVTGELPAEPVYDQTKAIELLEKAGWKLDGQVRKKDGQELRLSVVITKDSEYERVLETLIGQWSSVGVGVDAQIIDPADTTQNIVQDVLQKRNYDVLIYQLTIGADPDVFAYWHSSQIGIHGLNLSNYSNPISDASLASARDRLEPALRNAKYSTFAKQWLSDAPAIGLYQSTSQYVSSRDIVSVDANATFVSPISRYANVLYWTAGTRSVYKTP